MYSLPLEDLENICARAENFWPKNKKILITGGTGFFGRWLVESICFIEKKTDSKNRYVVISRQEKNNLIAKIQILSQPFFTVIQQDIQNPFKIDDSIDYIVHAASDVSKIKNSKESDFGSIVVSTQNLIDAVKLNPAGKFLYISSGGVYKTSEFGSKEDDLIVESATVINTYAAAKQQSELLVKKLKNSCIARCFSFVGPYVDPKMAVMDMLTKKIQKQSIIVNSPDVIRSFLYPSDLVISLFRLLFLVNRDQVYNVGSDLAISLLDLAKKISHIEGNSDVLYKDVDQKNSLAGKCYYPDTARLNSEYGTLQTIDLEMALTKTFGFLKKQGQQ